MNKISTIGLDIAKNSFSVHGFNAEGMTVLTRELKRAQIASFFARLESCHVGLEACASGHYWAREITKLGHDVRLIPAQRVKAFLPRQKNDAADTKAIGRAVRNPESITHDICEQILNDTISTGEKAIAATLSRGPTVPPAKSHTLVGVFFC